MRSGFVPVGIILVASLFAPAIEGQIAARYPAAGQANQGGARMDFKSAIARWDAGQKELQVGLLPFDVNDEDVEKVSKWQMVFYATVGKPSPNPALWNEPPYLVVILRLRDSKKMYMADDVAVCTLNLVHWKGASTIAIFLGGEEMKEVLKDLSFSPDSIKDLTLHLSETKDREGLAGFRYEATIGGK